MVGRDERRRLYTLRERHPGGTRLRRAAAKLLRQHADPLGAAAQLAQEQIIPLHDAIAFVAIAKQASKGRQDDKVTR